jgi:hypothetical protein
MVTPEKLNEALELISKGITRPTKIAKAMGISYRSYCSWMVRSNAGDEKFLVTYNSEEQQWARAITLATKLALFELRGMVLQESIWGYDEIQTRDGNVVWQFDPEACAIEDLDLREMLYGRRDGLKVIDGKLQPVTIKRKAPWAQQVALLRAAFPDLRESTTQNVNLNGAMQVGVGFAKPVDYSQGPPAVPPPPLRPELPAPVDAEFSEIDEAAGDYLPAPEGMVVAPININVQAEPEPEPDGYVKDALPSPPPIVERPPAGPMTPLQKDLWDRVVAARAKVQS